MTTPGDILRAGRGWKLGLSGGTFRARRWHSFFRISSGGFFFEEKVEKNIHFYRGEQLTDKKRIYGEDILYTLTFDENKIGKKQTQ